MIKKLCSILFIFILFSGCNKDGDTSVTPSPDSNRYPETPSNPSPSNGAVNVSNFSILLSWTCSDPDANDTLRYDVRYGATNNPSDTLVINSFNPSAYIAIADTSATIFWKEQQKITTD